jgi:hypothetical protein
MSLTDSTKPRRPSQTNWNFEIEEKLARQIESFIGYMSSSTAFAVPE